MYELTTLHPFIEGNKRTASLCADTLMILNDHIIVASNDERTRISLETAKMNVERDELIAWLRDCSYEKALIEKKNADVAKGMDNVKGVLVKRLANRPRRL